MTKKSPTSLIFGLIGAVILAGVLGLSAAMHFLGGGTQVAGGQAKIGGPFTLVNQDGETVTESVLLGKPSLIYFGYTYCPDVCPTSLSTMSDALDIAGPKVASGVQPVFISVDPERDTVPVVRDYVDHFYPGMMGLTGTVEQVDGVTQAYRVYAKAQKDSDSGTEDYLVDHSSITYLMDGNGDYMAHFSHGVDAEEMAQRLTELLR